MFIQVYDMTTEHMQRMDERMVWQKDKQTKLQELLL